MADIFEIIGPWIWLFFFLSVLTWILYKNTPLFRIASLSAVAVTLAQFIVQNWENVYKIAIIPIIQGTDYTFIIPH